MIFFEPEAGTGTKRARAWHASAGRDAGKGLRARGAISEICCCFQHVICCMASSLPPSGGGRWRRLPTPAFARIMELHYKAGWEVVPTIGAKRQSGQCAAAQVAAGRPGSNTRAAEPTGPRAPPQRPQNRDPGRAGVAADWKGEGCSTGAAAAASAASRSSHSSSRSGVRCSHRSLLPQPLNDAASRLPALNRGQDPLRAGAWSGRAVPRAPHGSAALPGQSMPTEEEARMGVFRHKGGKERMY